MRPMRINDWTARSAEGTVMRPMRINDLTSARQPDMCIADHGR